MNQESVQKLRAFFTERFFVECVIEETPEELDDIAFLDGERPICFSLHPLSSNVDIKMLCRSMEKIAPAMYETTGSTGMLSFLEASNQFIFIPSSFLRNVSALAFSLLSDIDEESPSDVNIEPALSELGQIGDVTQLLSYSYYLPKQVFDNALLAELIEYHEGLDKISVKECLFTKKTIADLETLYDRLTVFYYLLCA